MGNKTKLTLQRMLKKTCEMKTAEASNISFDLDNVPQQSLAVAFDNLQVHE